MNRKLLKRGLVTLGITGTIASTAGIAHHISQIPYGEEVAKSESIKEEAKQRVLYASLYCVGFAVSTVSLPLILSIRTRPELVQPVPRPTYTEKQFTT